MKPPALLTLLIRSWSNIKSFKCFCYASPAEHSWPEGGSLDGRWEQAGRYSWTRTDVHVQGFVQDIPQKCPDSNRHGAKLLLQNHAHIWKRRKGLEHFLLSVSKEDSKEFGRAYEVTANSVGQEVCHAHMTLPQKKNSTIQGATLCEDAQSCSFNHRDVQ